MNKSFHHILLGSLVLVTVVLSGCEKTVEIDPPLNEITASVVFSSDKLATSAMAGLYTGLANTSTQNNSLPVNSSIQADDLIYTGVNTGSQEFSNNAYSALSTAQSTIFADWYAIIYRANAIIEGLEKNSGTSDRVKTQFTAEAKAIRAYCYFHLVNTFGDVPLVLTTEVGVSSMLPRESVSNIYAQIKMDLTEAKAILPSDYSTSGNTRLGVNKFVVTALLARVNLFTSDYAAAEINASEVIASGLYSLIPSANIATGVWVKNNPESIWQMTSPLNNPVNQYTVEAGTFIPAATAVLQYEFRQSFLAIFTSTDLRRQRWMTNYTVAGVAKVGPYKYKYSTQALAAAAGVSESPTVLRLAEQYLIRAEARARIGANLSGSLSDLNIIRSRAQTALSTSTTPATLLSDIALENRKEFFCEQAYRWYNLKRTGEADAILTTLKPSYRPSAKLLPIPNNAIDANPNLFQNPGY
ncbi:RagB/SusD family nutrient uptake outer membrane protein [Pedobacter agri]|uniref:RagB/SusD family nutrient uptake outer membrane protein n=1 Tax=Pedobacter agri TaxID=454586 RepID=UPI002930B6F3|nr:RagB/SusD family nutrient uptake outer membrane protein [Pedobacter agri]